MNDMKPVYVAVLRRAIPVDGCNMDTATRILGSDETVSDVMAWADRVCGGTTVFISLEITEAHTRDGELPATSEMRE